MIVKCLNFPEADDSFVIIYLFFTGRNWSIRTVTIPFKELSLYGFKNSCLKSMFFLSTPLFVLIETSISPCRNAQTHCLKASKLYKLTFAKTSNTHIIIKSQQHRDTIKWKAFIDRVCYLNINRDISVIISRIRTIL